MSDSSKQPGPEGDEAAPTTTRALARTDMAMDLQPSTLEQVGSLGRWIVASKWFEHLDTPEKAAVVILQGRELGLPAMVAITDISVIKGKPTLSAALQVALIRSHPACEYFELSDATPEAATWVSKRRGRPERSFTFSMDDARAMGLLKVTTKKNQDGTTWQSPAHPGWHSQPRVMLMWRAAAFHARLHWSDVLKNLAHSTEEMQEAELLERTVEVLPPEDATPKPAASSAKGSRLTEAIRSAAGMAPTEEKLPEPEPAPEVQAEAEPVPEPAPAKAPEMGAAQKSIAALIDELREMPLPQDLLGAAWTAILPAASKITTEKDAKSCLPKVRTLVRKAKLAVEANELGMSIGELGTGRPPAIEDLRKWGTEKLAEEVEGRKARLAELKGGAQ